MYDGKMRSGLRGGKRALRAPTIGYGAGTMHGAEKARVGPNAGRERREEGDRIDLLHGLHCPDIVGRIVCGSFKLGNYEGKSQKFFQ